MRSEAESLILAAFSAARDQGKPEWQRMTTAVLKNRMLALSRGSFHESQYGAASFTEFVVKFGELLRVDKSRIPSIVELTSTDLVGPKRETDVLQRSTRIRGDLWRATFDFAGTTYVWDSELGKLRPSREDGEGPSFPSLSTEEFWKWREAFVTELNARATLHAADKEKLLQWSEHLVGSWFLSPGLRAAWNEFLKLRVFDRLSTWFKDSGIDEPEDISYSVAMQRREIAAGADELRNQVLETIRLMTPRELSEVQLPVQAVVRALRRRSAR